MAEEKKVTEKAKKPKKTEEEIQQMQDAKLQHSLELVNLAYSDYNGGNNAMVGLLGEAEFNGIKTPARIKFSDEQWEEFINAGTYSKEFVDLCKSLKMVLKSKTYTSKGERKRALAVACEANVELKAIVEEFNLYLDEFETKTEALREKMKESNFVWMNYMRELKPDEKGKKEEELEA
jgi:hypothetical protein